MKIKELLAKLRKNKPKPYYQSLWNGGTQGYINGGAEIQWIGENGLSVTAGKAEEKKLDKRIDKKPAEIFEEIISEEPKMNLVGLDKQIELVKRRADFLTKHLRMNPNDENTALAFLEARKKYQKGLFEWAITTQSKIDALCNKYKVKDVDFSGYYKNIPNEAIDELEKFCNVWAKVRQDDPYLRLIIDDKADSKERKKDPILLAGSPFGKWFYILGAWDKEVEIVDDLIYTNH